MLTRLYNLHMHTGINPNDYPWAWTHFMSTLLEKDLRDRRIREQQMKTQQNRSRPHLSRR